MRRKTNLDVNEPSIDRGDRQETSGRDGREPSASGLSIPHPNGELWSIVVLHGEQDAMGVMRSPRGGYYIDPPGQSTLQTFREIDAGKRKAYSSQRTALLAARILYPEYKR